MADHITANLPSRDFDVTEAFYARLGFCTGYRGPGWMILMRGPMVLEFFPHPDLDPKSSWFSASIRVDDIEGLLAAWQRLGISDDPTAFPRLTGIFKLPNAPRMFALVDPDSSLLRVLDNHDGDD